MHYQYLFASSFTVSERKMEDDKWVILYSMFASSNPHTITPLLTVLAEKDLQRQFPEMSRENFPASARRSRKCFKPSKPSKPSHSQTLLRSCRTLEDMPLLSERFAVFVEILFLPPCLANKQMGSLSAETTDAQQGCQPGGS